MAYYGMSPKDAYDIAPSKYGAASKFLSLQKVFNDAVRQNQWKMEQDWRNQQSDERRTRIGVGGNLVGSGALSPEQYGSFVNTGEIPQSSASNLASGVTPEEQMSNAGIPLEQQQDYRTVPQTYVYKGVPRTIQKFERKKDLAQKTVDELTGITSSVSDLTKNLNTLQTKNFNTGPGVSTRAGAIGDIAAQVYRGPEFTSWKADVGRAFQKYRKWATGVAAGYPELNLLSPNFPKTTDTPAVFAKKTLSAIDDMNRNQQIFLDYLNKAGYAVSAYRNQGESGKSDNSSNSDKENIRAKYNALRESGVSAAEAKKRLGL